MIDNVGLFLSRRARLSPAREAYVDTGSGLRLDYGELESRTLRLARALERLGVEPGERVALLLRNGVPFVETFFASARIGAVVVPINWRLAPAEVAFILHDSGASTVFFDASTAELAQAAAASAAEGKSVRHWIAVENADLRLGQQLSREDLLSGADEREPRVGAGAGDPLYIMYTSGTTGHPKGAVHTHESATWGCITIEQTLDLRHGDRYLLTTPMFHVAALTPMTTNVHRGVTNVVMRAFEPAEAWNLLEAEKINAMLAVPAMLAAMRPLFDAERDLSPLRWIMTGAAPVPPHLVAAYERLGIAILQVYGLTETCGPACVVGPDDIGRDHASTGKAFFHTDVRVVDDGGAALPAGECGEIEVRGRHLMQGYWNRPEATQAAFRDGWFRTGDMASIDEHGMVTIRDRIKDMIISGGENIYPAEIESVLLDCAGVADAAVVGRPSERWGERPVAFVVRRDPELSAERLIEACRKRLASYKVPAQVEFTDAVPRNPSGKILKRILRERLGLSSE